MSGRQPQRRPPGVGVSRQVAAPVGEDQGARHPGGGARDGEEGGSGGGRLAGGVPLLLTPLPSCQEREAEFEESMSKGDIPVVSAQRWDRPRTPGRSLTRRVLSAGTRRGSGGSRPGRQEDHRDGQSCESWVT